LRELLLHPGVGELVVRGTADDLRPEPGGGLVVERAAERARGVDVEVRGDELRGVPHHLDRRMAPPYPIDRLLVHIADHHLGALLDEVVDEAGPDLADALDADPLARQRGGAVAVPDGRAHALEDAERGEDGRVAGPAVLRAPAGDVRALPRDDVHVLAVRAHLARG